MDIQGTVQISIKQFDELREKAGELDRCRMKIRETGELLAGLVESLDDTEYRERIAAIDATENLTDRQLTKACAEAAGTLKVIISEKNLMELVHQYIDGDESDGHHDIKHMKKAEFDRIPLILGGSHKEASGSRHEDEQREEREDVEWAD